MLDYIALELCCLWRWCCFMASLSFTTSPMILRNIATIPTGCDPCGRWVSLFTLHVLWPFLWIWATLYRPERGWGFQQMQEQQKSDEALLLAMQEKLDARRSALMPGAQAEGQCLMETLILLTYAAICVFIFKVFEFR